MSKSFETVFVCIKQFNARLGDELTLKVGDKIEVLADDSEYNDGWYMGRKFSDNKVGLFPKSFTRVVESDTSDPPLLRSRSRRLPNAPKSKKNDTSSNKAETPKTTQMQFPKATQSTAKPQKDEVNSAIDEIDKALQELRLSSLDPSKGHLRNPSALSLTQDLNPLKATEWTPKQVSSYFAIVLGFDMDVAGKFARHKITGDILFELDLAHLKELEIDSFGTRFEVYKEIEKLKQIANRAKSSLTKFNRTASSNADKNKRNSTFILLAPLPFNNSDEDKSPEPTQLLPSVNIPGNRGSSNPIGHTRELSAASGRSFSHQRTRSQSMENILSYGTPKHRVESPSSSSFLSPRKAPEPPTASPMNKNFKFGGSPVTPLSNFNGLNFYMTRTSASSAALNNGPGLLRPASSIYDTSVVAHQRQGSNASHKRHSSVFLFLLGNNEEEKEKFKSHNLYKSPHAKDSPSSPLRSSHFSPEMTVDIDDVGLSPKKEKPEVKSGKKDVSRLKTLRSVSTHNFRSLTGLRKLKTSAFQEGIREINPDDAIKTANHSGWMAKKSGSTIGWRSRYFTLHGTRLSYFASLRDKREKGLIDITAHKVVPISSEGDSTGTNDKYIALYAALTGYGRYCFKLVPPAPGFKKGLTFTQPKTHYFVVETADEMRKWLKALMTATIDIDDSVPPVSSCNTPTVSLAKAQELLAKAREETKLKDEELRARGIFRDGDYSADFTTSTTLLNDSATSEEASPIVGSIDETTISSSTPGGTQPRLSVDTLAKNYRAPSTPQISSSSGGFASPYLLASGMLSPKQTTPLSKKDYFGDLDNRPPTLAEEGSLDATSSGSLERPVFSNSNGRVMSSSKKSPASRSSEYSFSKHKK